MAKAGWLRAQPDLLRKGAGGDEGSPMMDQAEACKILVEAIDRKSEEDRIERAAVRRWHDFSRAEDAAFAMAEIQKARARPVAFPWLR